MRAHALSVQEEFFFIDGKDLVARYKSVMCDVHEEVGLGEFFQLELVMHSKDDLSIYHKRILLSWAQICGPCARKRSWCPER